MVILFDQYNLPDNVYEIVFATEQQKVVAELLIMRMKENKYSFNKSEMSKFATDLHEGKSKFNGQKISYNKRQFYDRILTPMKSMGIVNYDMYKRLYSISKNFASAIEKISDMWLEEYDKKAS